MSMLTRAVNTLRNRSSLTAEHRRLALGYAAGTPEAHEVFMHLARLGEAKMGDHTFFFNGDGTLSAYLTADYRELETADFHEIWTDKACRECADSFSPRQQARAIGLLINQ